MSEKDRHEEVKRIISGLLTSTPLTCNIRKLQKDYKEMIGEDIPYQKLGYHSVEHFLRSIPDVVQVMGQGPNAPLKPIISQKVAHINQLVMKQRVKTSPQVQNKRPAMIRKRNDQIPVQHNNFHPIQRNNTNNVIHPQANFATSPSLGTIPLQYLIQRSSLYLVNNLNMIKHLCGNQLYSNGSDRPHNNINYNHHNRNAERSNRGVNGVSNQINSISQEISDLNINSQAFGANTKKEEDKYEFIPERIEKPIETIQINCGENVANTYVDEYGKNIPTHIKENLRRLITSHPKGIWCRDLPKEYFRMFGEQLDYLNYEYKSLISLCMDLPQIFHYVRPSKEDFKLYDRSHPLPQEAEKTFTVASYKVKSPENAEEKSLQDLEDLAKFLPRDIVIDQVIPRCFVKEDVQPGDRLDIVISEIWDINKFWIYLPDNKLDELMDDLQEFYNKYNEKYMIPKILIQEGLYCVCKFSAEYHRGIILTVYQTKPDVKVLLLDYGTVCTISIHELCFLAEPFAKLPFQAIQCTLANVKVTLNDRIQKRRLTQVFYDMVNQRSIIALVQKVNREEEVLDLYLIDQETNKSINDVMKEKVSPI